MEQVLAPQISKELSLDEPKLIENQLILSPGIWNGIEYTLDEIQRAFELTDWENKSSSQLYLDHKDTKDLGVSHWAGFVKNLKMTPIGLFGDLELWHRDAAAWSLAKPKFGISATLAGFENTDLNRMQNFHFESFSMVTDPACKPAIINLSNDYNMKIFNAVKELGDKIKELSDLSNNSPSENDIIKFKEANNMNKEEEKKEEKSEEAVKENLSRNDLKELSDKIDKLASILERKFLSEEEEKKEEKSEESKKVVVEEKAEEKPVEESKELSEVKQELNKLREDFEKVQNEPDVKTLSNAEALNVSRNDSNQGMLDFLRGRIQ